MKGRTKEEDNGVVLDKDKSSKITSMTKDEMWNLHWRNAV